MPFARFMATAAGRLIRIIAGAALIYAGLFLVGGVGGIVLAVVGLVPVAAGVFNFCGISELIGAPFWGRDTHARA